MNSMITEAPSVNRKQTSKLAVASLVFGIVSTATFYSGLLTMILISVNWITGIIDIGILIGATAFIFGIIAFSRIQRNPNLKGKGFAIVGLTLGSLMILMLLFILLFYFLHLFFPNVYFPHVIPT